jgi:hypothetical protein
LRLLFTQFKPLSIKYLKLTAFVIHHGVQTASFAESNATIKHGQALP